MTDIYKSINGDTDLVDWVHDVTRSRLADVDVINNLRRYSPRIIQRTPASDTDVRRDEKVGDLAVSYSDVRILTSNSGTLTWVSLLGSGSPDFTSSEQTLTAGSTVTVAHGLSAIPYNCQISLKVQSPGDLNFATGQEVIVYDQIRGFVTGVNASFGISASLDATNVILYVGADGLLLPNSSGVISTADLTRYKAIVRCWE